jgi:hypothetical protein
MNPHPKCLTELPMLELRPFEQKDWTATWQVIRPVFRAGETYPFSPDITEEEAYQAWVEVPSATFVAVDENNLVVSTNERAVRLWKRQGFEIVGTLHKAFRHRRLGFVDAFVMYKQLETA